MRGETFHIQPVRSMNAAREPGDQWMQARLRAATAIRTEIDMATAGFLIAVGIVASIIFMLTTRAERSRERSGTHADSSASDTGGGSSAIGGFSLLDWFSSSPPFSSGEAGETAAEAAAATSDTVERTLFRLVLVLIRISLELLKRASFPFASRSRVQYRLLASNIQRARRFHDRLFLPRPQRP